MIGRRQPPSGQDESAPRGFDDFDLRIGDVMRGERATIGKSLLDVQRELKIKATYIAAIENADISAFETTGFVAGYVRSYARYLGLDPEWTFETFCAEAGFVPPRGMDATAGAPARVKGPVFHKPGRAVEAERDPIAQPRVSFAPVERSPFTTLEPRAIGSTLVLLALIGAIGYGGWAVLKEVQRVTVAPVDRAPEAVAQVDPLSGVRFEGEGDAPAVAGVDAATPDALERLYRPQALETPVMTARDGPIAALDPSSVGALAGIASADVGDPRLQGPASDSRLSPSSSPSLASAAPGFDVPPFPDAQAVDDPLARQAAPQPSTPQVTVQPPQVMLVAVRPAWVRVRAADGTVLLERILEPGDSWEVPPSEAPPTLRTGAAGAVYFAVNGETYGPAGPNGAVVDQIALTSEALSTEFALADPAASDAAREAVAVAEAALTQSASPGDTETPPSE
jgi:hypothetical protein